MNLTAYLDIAIGLAVVYLGASLLVTTLNEYVNHVLNLRGRALYDHLEKLIGVKEIRKELREFPALAALFADDDKDAAKRKAPSYVDARVLAKLLLGTVAKQTPSSTSLDGVTGAVDAMAMGPLKKQLQAIVRSTKNDVDEVVGAVGDWIEASLTSLGESYKRCLRWISLGIGFAVAVGGNLDTIAITQRLYQDADAREATAALATQLVETTDRAAFDDCMARPAAERKKDARCAVLTGLVDAVREKNDALGKLPIGWAAENQPTGSGWLFKVFGWLLTAVALSLGAPFWFDFLNRFTNVRHGMRKPAGKGQS